MARIAHEIGQIPQPERQARIDLAAAYRAARLANFDDAIWNHFTLRVPGVRDRFLLKPHGLMFDEVTASNLLMVDSEGVVVAGSGTAEPSAFFIHSRIHLVREDAACVLHAHMPYATTLTLLRDGRLRSVHQDALRFLDRVAYYDDYNGLALTKEEGDRIVAALGDKDVLFMRRHGVLVVGPTVADAHQSLHYLELACKRQCMATRVGELLEDPPAGIARATFAQFEKEREQSATLHFDAVMRELDRLLPGYDA